MIDGLFLKLNSNYITSWKVTSYSTMSNFELFILKKHH